MNRTLIRAFVLCTAVLAALAPAVSSAPGPEITGKWVEVNGPDKVEFTSAGTFSAVMAYGMNGSQRAISGKYFVDEDKIAIQLNDDAPMTWKFKFSGGYRVVTYSQGGMVKEDGSMARFERQK
ncbi:MAG: hypothetical protein WCE75_15270 [Terracidiphilus sp.]